MRVAIVHDDLVQWGGAEKVLLGLSEIYPDAPIYTSVYDSGNKQLTKKFWSKKKNNYLFSAENPRLENSI